MKDFLTKLKEDKLLFFSFISLIIISLLVKSPPVFDLKEIEVIFILWSLFVVVKALELSGVISHWAALIEKGAYIPLKLVILTFFLSMFVTNDVALIIIVPLTLALSAKDVSYIVILEALSANAGSALTPFGNPQNLFIYWYFDITPIGFIITILPFCLFCLLLLAMYSLCIKVDNVEVKKTSITVSNRWIIFFILLILLILVVLKLISIYICFFVLVLVAILLPSSFRVDYSLLFTFFLFFALANNIKILFAKELHHPHHIFLLSIILSQIISNVPAAIVLSKFTSDWQALLWGTNIGGFGIIFGSMANLIAYKFYIKSKKCYSQKLFLKKFHLMSVGALVFSVMFYFAFYYLKSFHLYF